MALSLTTDRSLAGELALLLRRSSSPDPNQTPQLSGEFHWAATTGSRVPPHGMSEVPRLPLMTPVRS